MLENLRNFPPQPQVLSIAMELEPGQRTQQPAAYLAMGEGPPLLMLHGFLGDRSCWIPTMEKLSSHFRCIALDLLGFGESGKPAIRYDIAKEIQFVHQVIEHLSLDPCYILGHSFGGWVAAAYAIAYPQAVKGLFLAAPAGIRDDEFCGRYNHLRPLLWPHPVVDWVLAGLRPIAGLINQQKAMTTISWARKELQAQPAARSFLLDRLRPEDAVDTVEQVIHQIQAPTVVIAGDCDDTIPLWHCQTYASRIPKAQLIRLPEAGHNLPQAHSASIAEFIQNFVRDFPSMKK